MNLEVLKTNRLDLIKVDQKVMDFIFQDFSIEEAMELMGLKSLEAYFKERKKWEQGLSTFNRKFLYFFIRLEENQKTIGWCGYHTWYIDHQRAELGYGLYADEYKRQGFMSEVLSEIINYGFNEMNLNRIEALTATYNIASNEILKKFNFQFEGTLQRHYLVNDSHEDSLIYALFKH